MRQFSRIEILNKEAKASFKSVDMLYDEIAKQFQSSHYRAQNKFQTEFDRLTCYLGDTLEEIETLRKEYLETSDQEPVIEELHSVAIERLRKTSELLDTISLFNGKGILKTKRGIIPKHIVFLEGYMPNGHGRN